MGYFNYSTLLDGILKPDGTPKQGFCQNVDSSNTSSKAYCTSPDLRDVIDLNPGHTIKKMSHEIYGKETSIETQAKDLPKVAPMNGFVDYHASVANKQDEQLFNELVQSQEYSSHTHSSQRIWFVSLGF